MAEPGMLAHLHAAAVIVGLLITNPASGAVESAQQLVERGSTRLMRGDVDGARQDLKLRSPATRGMQTDISAVARSVCNRTTSTALSPTTRGRLS